MTEECVYAKTYNDYGEVIITLGAVLKQKKMNVYRLSVLTGINWGVVKNYAEGNLYRVDLDLLAKMCFVLKCNIQDLIYYDNHSNTCNEILAQK